MILVAYMLPYNLDCFAWVENKTDGDMNGRGDVLPAIHFPVGDAYSRGYWGVIFHGVKFPVGSLWDGGKNGFSGSANITVPFDCCGVWVLCTTPYKGVGWIEVSGKRSLVPSWFYPFSSDVKVAWVFPKYYSRGKEVNRKVYLYMVYFPIRAGRGKKLSLVTSEKTVIFSISFQKCQNSEIQKFNK